MRWKYVPRLGPVLLACLGFGLLFLVVAVSSVRPLRVDDLLLVVPGVLFFGGGGWAAVHSMRHDLRAEREDPRIRKLVGPVGRHDLERVRELVRRMREAPEPRARAELVDLGGCPGLLDALIFHAGLSLPPRPVARTPLDLVLDSLDRDGRVREAAVRAMAAEPLPGYEWFLVERAVDHVPAIRAVALEAIAGLLGGYPDRGGIVWRAFGRVAGRERAGELRARLEELDSAPGVNGPCCTLWTRQGYLLARRDPCWYARRELSRG